MKRKALCFLTHPGTPALSFACILLTGLISARAADAPAAPPPEPPPEPEIQDNDSSPYHVALLDYKAGHFQEALDTLNKGGAAPKDVRTLTLKSRILTELGRYDEGAKLLTPYLTSTVSPDIQLAMADLLLRKRDFTGAAKYYDMLLTAKPGDPDLLLMMIYTKIGSADLVDAAKIASTLKPLDPEHPSYYFAKAAIAQATDKSQEAEDDIETVRTMYGITVANHYLKTYLEVLSAGPGKNSLITPTNAPAASAPAAPAK